MYIPHSFCKDQKSIANGLKHSPTKRTRRKEDNEAAIEANGGRVHDTETCGMLLSQVERVGGLCVGSLICLQDHLQQLQVKLQLHLDIGIGSLSFAPPRSPS